MFSQVLFARDEYVKRLERAREIMRQNDIECLISTDDRDTWYFTGFGDVGTMGSRQRPRILILPLDGEPVFFVHHSTRACVEEMIQVGRVAVYKHLYDAPVEQIAEALAGLCKPGSKIGVELGLEQRINISGGDFLELLESLPDYEFVDSAPVILGMKLIKSPEEIERIRTACDITSRAYIRGLKLIKEGMTELEISGLLQGIMAEEGAMGTWCWVISKDYHRIDGLTRNVRVTRGDLIFIDMGANYKGYWSDFSRTAIIGPPTREQLEIYEKIKEVCALGVAAIKPGVTTGEVAGVVEREMKKRDLVFNSLADRYGHGMGILTTEPPNISVGDQTVIKPNMVLAMEPGMFRKDGMFHLEENVLVTENGTEMLSRAPIDIQVV